MAWMMDTYSMQMGYTVPEVVTGKPVSIGGSLFRREATGAGAIMVLERAYERQGRSLRDQRCVVQGFGNVGIVAAQELVARGARVIAVSDISGGLIDPRGLAVEELSRWVSVHGTLATCPLGDAVSNEDLLELPCDVLVLAAREGQITALNAPRIEAAVVVEGANGPTTPDADSILQDRGVTVLPDILVNSGGVTVSYLEWVQDLSRLFWTREQIRTRLADRLAQAFDRVSALAEAKSVTLRTAALVAGIEQVAAAVVARGRI
jgi:glutamate dehydrogenase (NAD(P)+)